MIKLTWLGHACFKIEGNDYTIICDPYEDGSVPGFKLDTIHSNSVYCSHQHHDHYGIDKVVIDEKENPFKVTKVESYHDDACGSKRGPNTIHVFELDGIKVAHMRDLGHPLSAEQIEAIGELDAIMIPIGGFYTIDGLTAASVAASLKAKVVVVMHYRSDDFGYDVLNTLDSYPGDKVFYDTNSITITSDSKPHTAVLKYM